MLFLRTTAVKEAVIVSPRLFGILPPLLPAHADISSHFPDRGWGATSRGGGFVLWTRFEAYHIFRAAQVPSWLFTN